MTMTQTEKRHQSQSRISAVDALRGFAIMAIMLLHNIEHFNYYSFPKTELPWLRSLDSSIWDMMFFTFSGKAYAIFALLFGFTFYLQNHHAEQRGEDFKNRYMWRLVLLLGFGFINSLFFPGEILVLYAILGFALVPIRHWSDKALLWAAVILMLQPVEWAKVLYALLYPDANPKQMFYSLGQVYPLLGGTSLWAMIKGNFVTGQLASLNWAWCYGRVFQTTSLFIFGLLIGRMGLFRSSTGEELSRSRDLWTKVLCYAAPLAIILHYGKRFLLAQIDSPFMKASLNTIFNSWYNLFFMLCIVAIFLLLYWMRPTRLQRWLVPYGQMSLTNYIVQSVIGSFLYFGYGLGLYAKCGITVSFCIGILFLVLQVSFARWWMSRHKRGPLESIWHKLTWIGRR